MVTPISEDGARAALLAAHSEAYDPTRFTASRRDRGWFFGWKQQAGDPPMGTRSWVVTDAGNVRLLAFRQTADEGIAEADGD